MQIMKSRNSCLNLDFSIETNERYVLISTKKVNLYHDVKNRELKSDLKMYVLPFGFFFFFVSTLLCSERVV